MAITYTTNLSLAKPPEGHTDWADDINTNWDTLDAIFDAGSDTFVKIAGDTMTGDLSLGDNNITNVGEIDLDLIRADAADGSVTIELDNAAGADLIVGNNNALVVEGDNDRVGIGTTAPDSIFHIKANVAGTVGSHPAGQLIIQDPDDTVFGNAVITGYESDGAGNPDQQLWYLGSSSSSNSNIIFLNRRNSKLQLGTNGVSQLTILGDGKVGINEAAPQDTLEVNGTVLVKDKLKFTQDDGNEFIDSLADGYMDYGATTQHRFNNSISVSGKIAGTYLDLPSSGEGSPNAGGAYWDDDTAKVHIYSDNVGSEWHEIQASPPPDEITATSEGVAASVVTLCTEVTTNGDTDLDNVTLANGTSGQVKHIYCVVEGNGADTWKITPATMCGGTQITFSSAAGRGCTLIWAENEGWVVVATHGGTVS